MTCAYGLEIQTDEDAINLDWYGYADHYENVIATKEKPPDKSNTSEKMKSLRSCIAECKQKHGDTLKKGTSTNTLFKLSKIFNILAPIMTLTCPKGMFKLDIYDADVVITVLLIFYIIQLITFIGRWAWLKYQNNQNNRLGGMRNNALNPGSSQSIWNPRDPNNPYSGMTLVNQNFRTAFF